MDLTREDEVKLYLEANGYASCFMVERLSEGFSGFVFRAHQQAEPQTLIVKHVEPWAARAKQYKLDQNRMLFEAKALRALFAMDIPGVRVPQVYHFDAISFVLTLEDVGQVPSLKSWIQADSDLDEVRKIGSTLGRFLAKVHGLGTELKSQFDNNMTARKLSSAVYFSRLPAEARKHGFEAESFATAAERGARDVLEAHDVLTIGDFWTGNILVCKAGHKEELNICVVDFEMAKTGTAAFDIGHMAAEMYCLAAFRDRERGMALLNSFLSSYQRASSDPVKIVDVAIRIGAHLFTVMPGAWPNEAMDDQIKEQLQVGAQLISAGVDNDLKKLRKMIILEELFAKTSA
ncbi:hypothetical protein AC578_566 [Pseudocercospora eumusae]|uniref:Aminoglycoside phosphotransferase domain-containing protein n=1 Tax=Pseudocercospora eumusae TaxID=321146 RepID=A0A139HYB2_9PEZI|nr:hypothetical protein AC578_566 [Pseudocercospora eumusae]